MPIFFSKSSIKFDIITNQIIITHHFINNFTLLYYKLLNSFYKILIKPIFNKIKFKGKGYYIYKNYRNTITPQFGYSHRLYLYAYHTHVKFLTKTSLLIFGLNTHFSMKTSKNILN